MGRLEAIQESGVNFPMGDTGTGLQGNIMPLILMVSTQSG